MKKNYSKPLIEVVHIQPFALMAGSKVYTDDPQKPSNALSRDRYSWDDEDEDEDW